MSISTLKLNTLTTLYASELFPETGTCIAHREVISIHVEQDSVYTDRLRISVQSDNVAEYAPHRVNNSYGSISIPMWLVKERGVLACTQLNNVELKALCGFGVRMCTVVRELAAVSVAMVA